MGIYKNILVAGFTFYGVVVYSVLGPLQRVEMGNIGDVSGSTCSLLNASSVIV
jgi:hypothetical protein